MEIEEFIELQKRIKELIEQFGGDDVSKMLDSEYRRKLTLSEISAKGGKVTGRSTKVKGDRPSKISNNKFDAKALALKLNEKNLGIEGIRQHLHRKGYKPNRITILKWIQEGEDKPKEDKVKNEEGIICPNCESKNIVKHGFRHTKNRGEIQKYWCQDCKKKFIEQSDYKSFIFNKEVVKQALNLYEEGFSLREIVKNLEGDGHKVSHTTVMAWIEKFNKKKQKPKEEDVIKTDTSNDIKDNIGNDAENNEGGNVCGHCGLPCGYDKLCFTCKNIKEDLDTEGREH